MPRITVAIPSYNHEKYIAQAIQSVLDQTFQDFEVVITDDGSTDGTVEVVKAFADPRIRLHCFPENQGASIAINNCIHQAKGEFIAVLSSDDLFCPDKLEKQISCLDDRRDLGAVFSYAQLIDEEGTEDLDSTHPCSRVFKQPNRNRYEWLRHFFYNANALCHPSVLIRRSCYEKVGYYDERLAQLPDFEFWIRLCLEYEIYIIPERLIKFRIHSGEINASGNRPDANRRLATEHAYILRDFLKLDTADDLFRVFPEARQYEVSFSENLIPFYLSMLAITKDSTVHQHFAVFTLFELLHNQGSRQALCEKYGFTMRDFITLTGTHDLFNADFINRMRQKDAELSRSRARITQLEEATSRLQEALDRKDTSLSWRLLDWSEKIRRRIVPTRTR